MKALEAYKEVLQNLPEGIRLAEVEAETEGELSAVLQNGVHNGASLSEVTSLFVKTLGEKAGFTYTQNLEEDPSEVLLRAHESSVYSENTEMYLQKPGEPEVCRSQEPECEPVKLQELWNAAEAVDQWLTAHYPTMAMRMLCVTDRIRTVGGGNSEGLDACVSSHSFCLSLFAADEQYPGSFLSDEITVRELSELKEDLFAEKLETWYWNLEAKKQGGSGEGFVPGSYRCVLDGKVMNNIFLTAWRMFTEDNYQKKSTPFAGRMQTAVGSSKLTVTDRSVRKGSGYRFAMDCEGSVCRDVTLIRDGVLTGLLSNLTSAQKAEAASAENIDLVPSTGNAGRKDMISGNIHTNVVTIPKNFGVEPGSHSLMELLEELSDGIYIYESFDMFHSVNTVSGEYSIPCNGILLQNGRPVQVMEGLTINGRVQDILANTELVGTDVSVCPMLMLNSFTVSSPSILVEKLNVSK